MFQNRAILYFIIFGIVFTLLSIPFFTGMMRPSFSERNPYALFYAFFNLPVTLPFKVVITSLASFIWDSPTIDQVDLTEFFVSLAFWSILGAIIGWVNGMRGNRGA